MTPDLSVMQMTPSLPTPSDQYARVRVATAVAAGHWTEIQPADVVASVTQVVGAAAMLAAYLPTPASGPLVVLRGVLDVVGHNILNAKNAK